MPRKRHTPFSALSLSTATFHIPPALLFLLLHSKYPLLQVVISTSIARFHGYVHFLAIFQYCTPYHQEYIIEKESVELPYRTSIHTCSLTSHTLNSTAPDVLHHRHAEKGSGALCHAYSTCAAACYSHVHSYDSLHNPYHNFFGDWQLFRDIYTVKNSVLQCTLNLTHRDVLALNYTF